MKIRRHYELIRTAAMRADGQTMAEYGVVLGCIVLGVIAAMGALAATISGGLGSVSNALASVI
jgi:Flp pilus assembly pilin Flp